MADLPNRPDDSGTPDEPGDGGGVPEEILNVFRDLTGGRDLPPGLADQLKAFGIDNVDPTMLRSMAQQMQSMFSGGEAAVDEDVATDLARRLASESGDRSMGDHDARLADQAATVARLWLDEVTALDAPNLTGLAWSRAEWIEATMPVWVELIEPVADGVGEALNDALTSRLGNLPPQELAAMGVPAGLDPSVMLNQMKPMIAKMSTSMFTMQLGQAVGGLAAETLTGTEVSLPLLEDGDLTLLPTNIAAFAEGLDADLDEVWIFLAVRESARQRLFTAVPWIAPQILQSVRDYARDITIDTAAIEAAVERIDPTDPEGLSEMLKGSLFTPHHSAAQKAALARLETWLALVEGWVEVVTARATNGKLPHADALAEMMRRRRAAGGPAEQAMASLVGLELRPRRMRDAANLWSALENAVGASSRDAAWGHPDVAPTAADLDDVLGYVERVQAGPGQESLDMDAELDKILRGEGGDASGTGQAPTDPPA